MTLELDGCDAFAFAKLNMLDEEGATVKFSAAGEAFQLLINLVGLEVVSISILGVMTRYSPSRCDA